MNIFLIEIGKTSRRGNFEKLFQKVVSVPDSCYYSDMYQHFRMKYEGFDVRVSQVEEVAELSELSEPTVVERKESPHEKEFYLHFRVKYTEREQELHAEYRTHQEKAGQAIMFLHSSIEERFRKLYYSDIHGRRPMVLRTDSFATYCDKFPINGVLFETAARKADEGFTPDPVPEPAPAEGITAEDEELPEVPF
jgi:hypothetical protein